MENFSSVLNIGQLCFFHTKILNKENFHLNNKKSVSNKLYKLYNSIYDKSSSHFFFKKLSKKEKKIGLDDSLISKVIKIGLFFCFFFF